MEHINWKQEYNDLKKENMILKEKVRILENQIKSDVSDCEVELKIIKVTDEESGNSWYKIE